MHGEVLGREYELEATSGFLEELERGSAALVIEGEAGIGKTTLWLEALDSAERRGYRVLKARPAESEAKLSYAALADLVGGVFEATRAGLPEPQERALAAALLRADVDEPPDAQTTAVALVGVLFALAVEGPVVVAVDDEQWLDAASERALRFAARRLPPRVGVLVTRRAEGGGEVPLGLGGALEVGPVVRLVPGPLSVGALQHLISSRLGLSLPRPLLIRVASASGGNPFFALEIARGLASTLGDRALGDPLPVPESMQDLVARRVRGLSAAAQEAILVAATLARPTIATVRQALMHQVDAEPALVEAEEAGVFALERGRIRFTHPLLASAVIGSVSMERLRQLHRRLADMVVDPEERARHLASGATDVDEATAAEVERGARQAALRGAPDTAAELFEASHRLTPADCQDGLARRLLGHASARNALGDFVEARALAERAVASACASSLRAEGLVLLGTLVWYAGAVDVAIQHLEEALAAASPDRGLQGRIHAKLVRFHFALKFERAAEHADAAMALLREERDPMLLGHVILDQFFVRSYLGRAPARDLLERGLELEAKAQPTGTEAPHPFALVWLQCMDELDVARTRYAMEDDWYRQRGDEVMRADRRSNIALVELRAGRWALAEEHIEECCAALEKLEVQGPMALAFEKRALIDAHRGRIELARAAVLTLIATAERSGQPRWAVLSLATLGFVEFAAGNHGAADEALTRMYVLNETAGVKDVIPERSEPFHIEGLVALGEIDRARDVLMHLEERGRALPRTWITVTLPRARALVLAAEGDMPAALAAIDQLDGDVAAHLPFELASTLLVKGRLLRRAKQKRAAADALQQAIGLFEQLGAPVWIHQAQRELDRVGLRPAAPRDLTEAERRVAELVATGLTNREVAAQLFISPKTVEANLSRAYRKLGISSRAELGAWRTTGRNNSPQT